MINNQWRFRTFWDLSWVFQLLYSLFLYCVWLCVSGAVRRYELLQKQLFQLEEAEGGFDQFTRSYRSFGVQRLPDNGLFFKEWAPAAEALFLTGDFSKWHLQVWLKPLLLPVLVGPVPLSLSVLKIEPKNSHWAVSHVSKLLQLRRNDRFNDAVALCVCHISVWWHGRRKSLCSGARQRGGRGCVPCQVMHASHRTYVQHCMYVVVSHHFELLWDMETLKILITLDLSLFTGEWSLDCGRVNILAVGYFIIARNRRPFTEISIPSRRNFESNFSLISCLVFIFSCCGL